jgi:hypothetical protein
MIKVGGINIKNLSLIIGLLTICCLLIDNGTSSSSSDTKSASYVGQITKPTIVPISDPSISLSGNGKGAALVTLDQGLTIFNMTHDGSSNFIVHLLDSNGGLQELLVNEIGLFKGPKLVGIEESGLYGLDIDADGNWTINITQPIATS